MNGSVSSIRVALLLTALAPSVLAQVSSGGGSSGSSAAPSATTTTRPTAVGTSSSTSTRTGTADSTATTPPATAQPATTPSATGGTRPGATTLNPIAMDPPSPADPAGRARRTTLNPAMDPAPSLAAPRRTTLNPYATNPPTPANPLGPGTTLNRAGQDAEIILADGTRAPLVTGNVHPGTSLLGSGIFVPTSMAEVFVTPLEQSGEWLLVRRADGRQGWMPVSLVPALARSASSQLDVGGQMVLGRSVTLFGSLDVEGAGSSRAMAGDTIVVLERSGDWLLVRAPNGNRGWVLEDMLVGLGPVIEKRIEAGTLDALFPRM